MATFYWVGGNGNWDATTTTNWASSSGGAGGAGVPTSGDDVIFDAGSNTGTNPFTVTVTGTSSAPAVCNDFSTGGAGGALDGTMTLTMGATARLDIYGSMTLPATNFIWSGTAGSELFFRATTTGKTVTTNGVLIQTTGTNFDGAGGGWTLGSAYTGVQIRVNQGTLDTGNYNVSGTLFNTNVTTTRTVTLGSSALSFSGSSPFDATTTTGLTFNAGTSTISCSAASPTFNGGGLTFYNVTFSSSASGATTINGANTFNDLTQTSRSATGSRQIILGDSQTVSGTLTLGAANTAIRRIWVRSNSFGIQRTITLNGSLATLADVDFKDINAAGTVATPWTGTRLGDGKNNNNITFDAPKTVYWNLAGTQNWSATGWATTNNGTPAVNNFPLAQDTATFTEAGAAGTITLDSGWVLGSIQMADGVSNRTTAFTLATSNLSPQCVGNITLFSNLTLTGTGSLGVSGYGTTQTITSAGVSFTQGINFNSPTGTFVIADAFTQTAAAGFIHSAGTVDLNDLTLTCVAWSSSNTNTRSIDFGTTGQITVTGNNATVWNIGTATGFTISGTPTVNSNYSGSTGTRTITNTSAISEANQISFNITAGTDTVIATSGFRSLNFNGFSGTFSNGARLLFGNLFISSGMTVSAGSSSTTFAATSGTQQITTNGLTLDFPITQNSPGATLQLQDNLTIGSTRTFSLTAGTLDLDDNKLTTGIFSSTNTNTRSIGFGTTGEIEVTGNNATVWSAGTLTNFSYTGTSKVVASYSGATGTRNFTHGSTAGTESNAVNFFITAGTDQVAIARSMKNAVFTGFSGTFLIGSAIVPRFIYGNFTFSPTATITGGDALYTFAATSGTQEITSAGVTFDVSMAVNAPGATVQLQDALTMGSTRTLTLTAGTFDSDGYALSTGLFDGSGTTARTLSMGASTWTITGAGTAWNLSDTTSLTLNTDTSTISMTGSSPHTFAGGSQTYYNLNVGGTGDLTIVGDNTFNEISDSVNGSTVYFTAGSTTTTTAFTVDGGVGDLILLRSTTPGSVWFLEQSSGSVGITYVDIQDSDASGGATFQCINGVNSGNNTGWQFIDSGGSGGNFFIFF